MDKSVKTSEQSMSTLGKANEQVQMQDFSSKNEQLVYLAPCGKKKKRAPDSGSSPVFVTKVLLPDDAAPGISATLAKTMHLVHVNVCSYFF